MEREAGEHAKTAAAAVGRAEIDTRPPFGSVREAVALFGEKVLSGEIYASKLREIRTTKAPSASPSPQSRIRVLTAELEQTKQTLSKTLEENTVMSQRIKTIRDELERARREIQQLKPKHKPTFHGDPEIEELKFVEQRHKMDRAYDEEEIVEEFEKRRLVKFASPPSLTRVIMSAEEEEEEKEKKKKKALERPRSFNEEKEKKVLERHPSVTKTKKKSSVPFMGWFLSKKKGSKQEEADNSPTLGY